jgi:hypothetical protein
VLQHRAVTANADQLVGRALSPGDRYLVVAPLYSRRGGSRLVLDHPPGRRALHPGGLRPAEAVRAMSEDGIVGATLVPAMIQACLVGVPDVAKRRFDDLRTHDLRRVADRGRDAAQGDRGVRLRLRAGLRDDRDHRGRDVPPLPADHERALRDKPELLLSCGARCPARR